MDLHQITVHHVVPGDSAQWHPVWRSCLDSWNTVFSEPGGRSWHQQVWNFPDDTDRLIWELYPEYWNLNQVLPDDIMRMDLARICVLHAHGGIIAEPGYFVYRHFAHLLEPGLMILGNATQEHHDSWLDPALMSSPPGHPLLRGLLDWFKSRFIQHQSQIFLWDRGRLGMRADELISNITGAQSISQYLQHQINSSGPGLHPIWPRQSGVMIFLPDLFNNHSMAYRPEMYGKNLRCRTLGRARPGDVDSVLLVQDLGFWVNLREFEQQWRSRLDQGSLDYQLISVDDLDFFQDYTPGRSVIGVNRDQQSQTNEMNRRRLFRVISDQ